MLLRLHPSRSFRRLRALGGTGATPSPTSVRAASCQIFWSGIYRGREIFGRGPRAVVGVAVMVQHGWEIPRVGLRRTCGSNKYVRYGVAIWQAKRMVHLGLWSSDATEDMSEHYRRSCGLLFWARREDISRYKQKIRFDDEEDYEGNRYQELISMHIRRISPTRHTSTLMVFTVAATWKCTGEQHVLHTGCGTSASDTLPVVKLRLQPWKEIIGDERIRKGDSPNIYSPFLTVPCSIRLPCELISVYILGDYIPNRTDQLCSPSIMS